MKKTQWVAFFILSTFSHGAFTAESTSAYSFGGACSSQGLWTQTALSTTQSLRQVIHQLKDNPNCTALGNKFQASINNLESSIQASQSTPAKESRMAQIPGEINALRSYVLSTPKQKDNIYKMIMNRSIEGATLNAQVTQNNGMVAGQLMDLGARVERGAKVGLTMLNDVIDTIPQLDECLDGDGAQVLGTAVGASIKIASAFASSGESTIGSQLANTVSKLTSLGRMRKYSKALRELNKQEYRTSMSCLMEVTSETYCQARDQMMLFKGAMKDLKVRPKKLDEINKSNPFAGFYILNTHVPNITRWLQKVQIGVDPKLPTDATFQNNIQQEVTNFYKDVKEILGEFNQKAVSIKAFKDQTTKKLAVINLVIAISEKMRSSNYSRGEAGINFFTMSTPVVAIPFNLLGMSVPSQVSGKEGGYVLPYNEWLLNNQDRLIAPPETILEAVGTNISNIIRAANVAAIEYYNQWYIVDKAALVNESMTNINYTIVDSLRAINGFLDITKARIIDLDADKSSIPNIIDTQARINKVLTAYKDLDALGKHMAEKTGQKVAVFDKNIDALKKQMAEKNGQQITEEELLASAAVHEKVINTIFEQFNIMLSRSGFLANRMINFVYNDYTLLINNSIGFSEQQKNLFISQGMSSFDTMLQSYNGNPANIYTDLNNALTINIGNIEALEMILKNSLAGTMSELYAISNGGDTSFFSPLAHAGGDLVHEIAEKNFLVRALYGAAPYVSYLGYYLYNHDRYPMVRSGKFQSEFNNASNLLAQLCVQSLAFSDRVPFVRYCSGRVLLSPFEEENQLNTSYNEVIDRHLSDKNLDFSMRKALNFSDRVCALRDYNRRNMVRYIQQDSDI